MLSTPFICCSIGVATDCSMVIASAPVKVVEAMIWGGTMSGNWANGRLRIAITPTTTVRMAMTIATIVRLMKKVEIMVVVLPYCDGVAELATNGFGLTTISGLTC